jgi:hypothetical protein
MDERINEFNSNNKLDIGIAMNQLQVMNGFDQAIVELENTQKMCSMLMKTPHYAKMGQEGIFAVVSKAKSLGMDQIEALNGGLYYLQGKVGMPAETMAALIRQKGHSIIKDKASDNSVCILHGKRADNGDTWSISFSVDDAKRAGLLKNMYDKYPAGMLYNRAMSFLARQLFPDIIRGAGYTMDELKEIASNNTSSVVEIQPKLVEVITKEQAEELETILSECDEKYQEAVWNTLKKPPIEIDSLEQLPLALYARISNAARKNRDTYQLALQNQREEISNKYAEEAFEEVANEA